MCKYLPCFLCYCYSEKDAALLNVTDFQSIADSSNRVLVFLNPKSGAGLSLHIWNKQVFPALIQSSIAFELIKTEFSGHAAQIVERRQDLLKFNAIVIVSGDGLIFEVLNAILTRQDAVNVLRKLPFAIIPCGSGNGLLSAVFAHRQQSIVDGQFLETAIETLVHPHAISLPVNLVKVQTNGRKLLASFLSIGFGLMAEIDIESESLRTLCGGHRFFWGALWRVASNTYYCYEHTELNYRILEAPDDIPLAKNDHQLVYRQEPLNQQENPELNNSDPWTDNIKFDVPDIESPIPSNWTTIEDEFILLYAVTISHISSINVYAPEAKLNEQQIHLTYILKKDIKSKAEVAKFLMAIESKKHLDLPCCHYLKVRAFRFEPDKQSGQSPIVIDGEVIPETKIQAMVSDLCFRVVSK